jgi:hypothetical protein
MGSSESLHATTIRTARRTSVRVIGGFRWERIRIAAGVGGFPDATFR